MKTTGMIHSFVRGAVVLFLTASAAVNAAPAAVDPAALYPAPGEETVLRAAVPAGSEYIITDLAGKECGRGHSVKTENSEYSEVHFSLPRGWHRIHFPAKDMSIGIAVTPDSPQTAYWNIDAGLTWNGWPRDYQKQMVKTLRRKGIATFRERMSWPLADGEHFKGSTCALRADLYRGDCLELFQDSPHTFRLGDKTNPFYLDFAKAAESFRQMESAYRPAWSAVELWNEPFYIGNFPPDQYVPVAKLAGAVLESPVCGGCSSPSIPHAFLDVSLKSGFGEILDALSLHFYGSPESMKEVIPYYRKQLKGAGRETMPLWVTESGCPDPSPDGAPKTTMRAIECRTLGVDRYYAFYLQHHQEGSIDWGMSDKYGTPRPALAYYLTAVNLLGNKEYCGDVKVQGDVSLVHCFSGREGSVLVLYGSRGAELTLPVQPDSLAGADGREIPVSGKVFRNADGIGYAFYAPGKLKNVLQKKTPNMKYWLLGGKTVPRQKLSVVLQTLYPKEQILDCSNHGYTITPKAAENYTAAVICNNVTGAPLSGTLALELSGGKKLTQKITIPAHSGKEAEFKVNFRGELEQKGECTLKFSFTDGATANDRIIQHFLVPVKVRAERLFFTNGKAPDWANAKVIRDTKVCGDVPGELQVPPEEFSSEAQFLWSDYGIHFRVSVHDLQHEPAENDGTSWMRDSLQIAVSQYNSENDNNRFEWGFWLDAEGKAHKATFSASTGQNLSDKSKISIRRDEKTHTTLYQGLIDWDDLGSMKAINNREKMRLRLTFCVNDCNKGNRRWSEWTPGIAKDKNPDDFVEFTLVSGKQENTQIPLKAGKYLGNAADCTISGNVLKLKDSKNGALEFRMQPVPLDMPVTLKFELAATEWEKHNGNGFSFTAALRNSELKEEYIMYASPSPVYAGTTGYMIYEKNEPGSILGPDKKTFSPSGHFHKMEFTIDTGARNFELAVTPPGDKREVIASGPIRHNTMKFFDKIVFSTSGWGAGAGPFLLKNISIVHQ